MRAKLTKQERRLADIVKALHKNPKLTFKAVKARLMKEEGNKCRIGAMGFPYGQYVIFSVCLTYGKITPAESLKFYEDDQAQIKRQCPFCKGPTCKPLTLGKRACKEIPLLADKVPPTLAGNKLAANLFISSTFPDAEGNDVECACARGWVSAVFGYKKCIKCSQKIPYKSRTYETAAKYLTGPVFGHTE